MPGAAGYEVAEYDVALPPLRGSKPLPPAIHPARNAMDHFAELDALNFARLPGGLPSYSDLAITTALMLRAIVRLAEGLVGSSPSPRPQIAGERPLHRRPMRQDREAADPPGHGWRAAAPARRASA